MKIEGFRVAVEWTHPYREPPDGKPRILIERFFITKGGCPKIPDDFHGLAPLGSGYGFTVQHIGPPPRRMEPEKLASIRIKRLRRRIERKYPLLAEQLIREEIDRKKEYYEGVTDAEIERNREGALVAWQAVYDRLVHEGIKV